MMWWWFSLLRSEFLHLVHALTNTLAAMQSAVTAIASPVRVHANGFLSKWLFLDLLVLVGSVGMICFEDPPLAGGLE